MWKCEPAEEKSDDGRDKIKTYSIRRQVDLDRDLGHCIINFGFPVRDRGMKCENFACFFFFFFSL